MSFPENERCGTDEDEIKQLVLLAHNASFIDCDVTQTFFDRQTSTLSFLFFFVIKHDDIF